MTPYRQPEPPPESSGTGDLEAAIGRMAARRRALMGGLIAAGLLLVAAPYVYIGYGRHAVAVADAAQRRAEQLNDAEQNELDDLLARADVSLAAENTAFQNATSPAALAKTGTGEGICSDAPSAPEGEAAASYIRYGSIDAVYFGNASYVLVHGDDTSPASPVASWRSIIARVRAANAKHEATRTNLTETRDILTGRNRGVILFIVVASETDPDVSAPASDGKSGFDAGELRGRGYLYRNADHRVACAGDLSVTSSPSVDITTFTTTLSGVPINGTMAQLEAARSGVKRDFEVQIRRALATDLHAL